MSTYDHPETSAANSVQAAAIIEETLVEEVYIDGMCGVY